MAFSWEQLILNADKNILRQAKLLAKANDQKAKLEHPDEARDASQGNYTKLTIRIKDELAKKRKIILDRREKIAIGKKD